MQPFKVERQLYDITKYQTTRITLLSYSLMTLNSAHTHTNNNTNNANHNRPNLK